MNESAATTGARTGASATEPERESERPRRRARGLGQAARRGVRLGTISSLLQQLLSVVTTVALAHMLTPAEFGLAAAANSAVALVTTLTQIGFSQRLIVARNLTPVALGTTYWFSVVVGLVAGGVVAALSLPLAMLVGVSTAAPLILLLAPAIAFRVIGTVPRMLMLRNLRFRAVYAIDVIWTAVYCAAEVVLASQGFGARAIPLGLVIGVGVFFTLNSLASRLIPPRRFSIAELRAQLPMQGTVQANALVGTAVKNADYWLVGNVLGAVALGVYYVAYVVPSILRQRLTWVTSEVLMPIYARLRDDRRQLTSAYQRSLRLHALLGGLSMGTVAVVADPLVRLCFGIRWVDASAPLRIIAVAAAFDFLTSATLPLFLGCGRPGFNLLTSLTRLALLAALSPVLILRPSLVAMAWLVLVASVFGAIASLLLAARLLDAPLWHQARGMLPVGASAAGMAAVGFFSSHSSLAGLSPIIELSVLLPGAVGTFMLLHVLIDRRGGRSDLADIWRLACGRSAGPD